MSRGRRTVGGRLSSVGLAAALAAAGCSGSVATAPSPRPVPTTWASGAAVRHAAEAAHPADSRTPSPEEPAAQEKAADIVAAASPPWWAAYNDPLLVRLVEAAETADSVALAEARLAEAEAGLRRATAVLAPEISGSGAARRERTGDDALRIDSMRAAVSAVWSPDFSGADRARRRAAAQNSAAARARLEAARLDARAAAVHLYVAVRRAQGQASTAERTAATLADTLVLVEARHRAGLVSDLDLAQAGAVAAAAPAAVSALRRAEAEARLALEALLGVAPGQLAADLAASPTATVVVHRRPATIAASVADRRAAIESAIPTADLSAAAQLLAPVEVLAQRPDLRAAEALLVAAGWEARAARADFWPRVSLAAAFGGQDVSPAFPFSADGGLYSLGASLAAPLFTFGRLEAARDAADARAVAAAVVYREAATRALVEVERALVAGIDAERRRDALAEALAAARTQALLARERYTSGLVPLLEVLSAERTAFEAEAALLAALADAATAFSDLSTAMGLDG